jgi:hypothetical protein
MKKYIPEVGDSFIMDKTPDIFIRISNDAGDHVFTTRPTDPTKCIYLINLSSSIGGIMRLNNIDEVEFKKAVVTFSE